MIIPSVVVAPARTLGICRGCGVARPTADLAPDIGTGTPVCRDEAECLEAMDVRFALRPQTEWTARGRLRDVLSAILAEHWQESPTDHLAAWLIHHGAVRPERKRDVVWCMLEHFITRRQLRGPGYLADALINADLVHDIARDAVVRHVAGGIVRELHQGATLERAVRRPVASGQVYADAVAAGLRAGVTPWRCALASAEVLTDRATTGLPVVYLRCGRLATVYPGFDARGWHVSVDADGTVWRLAPHADEWVRA